MKRRRGKSKSAAYAVARKLRIKVVDDELLPVSGRFRGGRTIYINPHRSNPYTVLHEIGHVLCGYGCCREHSEYMAHGAAIALARVHGIPLKKEWLEDIDGSAGCSPRKACAAIEAHKERCRERAARVKDRSRQKEGA